MQVADGQVKIKSPLKAFAIKGTFIVRLFVFENYRKGRAFVRFGNDLNF